MKRQLRILLVGEYGVGKTAFVERLRTGQFIEEYKSTTEDTNKTSLMLKISTLEESRLIQEIELIITEISDLSQDISKHINTHDCAIIMFESSDYKTYPSITYWLNKIPRNFPIVIVANKYDKPEKRVSLRFLQKTINAILNSDKCHIHDISVKYNNGVDDPIIELIRHHFNIDKQITLC